MQDSIFTKIIKGEIPCHKIYEDEQTIAFLDIHPIQPGQILVVSKLQIGNFFDLPELEYAAFFATIQKIAKHLKVQFPDKERIGVMLEGLDIDHVHAKVFPINTGEEYRYEPDMTAEPNHEALAVMAKRLSLLSPGLSQGVDDVL